MNRRDLVKKIDRLTKKKLIPLPLRFVGKVRLNHGGNYKCDFADGPCACGAWHRWRDWPEEVQKALLKG